MKYIAVFCSASDLEEKYTKPAEEFARLFSENGYGLVWGGSDVGLMKIMADGVQQGGGKIVGVSMETLKDKARKNADEMIIAKTLGLRKATMLEKSDAIVCLVGGIGTLDEVSEILELKRHGLHSKPIIILNTENFYEGLKMQLQRMKDDGFVKQPIEDYIYFANSPIEAMNYVKNALEN